jgi:hypothetical protein
MSYFDAAESLLKAIKEFDQSTEGDSGDLEYEKALAMKDAALEFVRMVAARDVDLADLVDQYTV